MRSESSRSPGQSPWNPQRIRELLVAAGKLAVELREDIRFELKPDSSLVTQADHQIEALFASEFDRPEQGSFLIGEETVEEKGEDYLRDAFRGTAYIVDPIDGTAPYAHLLANWGISVGRMQAGFLTDGAVFLPDYRLMVLSDGPAVLAGTRPEGSEKWTYRELVPPPVETGPSGLVAVTQDLAKLGRVSLANPVQALGSAVVPLVGMLVGRFLAYVGSLRLWDIAGSLPLLHRLTFSITRLQAPAGTPLGLEVGPESYLLDPDDSYRWGVRGGVLVCPSSEMARIRKGVGL